MDDVHVRLGKTNPFENDILKKVLRSLEESNDPLFEEFRDWVDSSKGTSVIQI